MRRILNDGEGWEGGQRIPIEHLPIEYVTGIDPQRQDAIADEMRGEVLETLCSLLIYLSQSPRPTLLLDALAVVTGLILTDAQTAKVALARKHGLTCQEFEAVIAEASRKLNLPSQSAISPLGRAQMAGCSIVPPCPQKPATMNPVTCYAHAGEL